MIHVLEERDGGGVLHVHPFCSHRCRNRFRAGHPGVPFTAGSLDCVPKGTRCDACNRPIGVDTLAEAAFDVLREYVLFLDCHRPTARPGEAVFRLAAELKLRGYATEGRIAEILEGLCSA